MTDQREPTARVDRGHRVTPLVIGHRGASAARPENTVEAYRHAAELGADWVELDVRRTADDALVIHHDAELPDGRVIVELTAVELPASVPTLAVALTACRGMGINVEIKNDRSDPDYDPGQRVASGVTDLLVSWAAADQLDLARILVTSFNPHTIDSVRSWAPAVPTGLLVFDLSGPDAVAVAIDRAARAGHRAINPWDPLVDETLMALARAAGLAVYPWTVDDPERMAALLDLEVDGIITNVPDVARAVVDSR